MDQPAMPLRLRHRLLAKRSSRWIGAGVFVLAVGWALLHAVLNGSAMAARVRGRADAALASRLAHYSLGTRFEVSWTGEVKMGPLFLNPGEERPTVRVDELRVRPALGALLGGSLRAGRVTLARVEVRTDAQGKRLRELLDGLQERRRAGEEGVAKASEPGPLPELAVEDARVVVESAGAGDDERVLGPIDMRARPRRVPDGYEWDASVWLGSRGEVEVEGRFSKSRGLALSLSAREVQLPKWIAPPTVHINDGAVSCDISVLAPADFERVTAKVLAQVDGLVVAGDRIASERVGPASVGYVGALAFDRSKAQITVEESHLLLGQERLPIPFHAQVDLLPKPRFDLDVRLGPVALQTLIGALPGQLAPGANAPHLDGVISAQLKASGPLSRPDQWKMALKVDEADLKERARQQPFALREPFSYIPPTADPGDQRTLWIGPPSSSYVPLRELPPIVGQAVITSEDAGFYVHQGFDLEGIQNGLVSAVDGAKLRGGSTLTQQLVKNVYLTRDRTLARKISEALITTQVEAALSKQRILELYLNIIEWGPGIFGIDEAARHYFGVGARSLDAKQAVFLASIIPNPTKWGPYLSQQGLNDSWQKRLSGLLDTLHERSLLTDDEYERALDEPLRFRAARVAARPR